MSLGGREAQGEQSDIGCSQCCSEEGKGTCGLGEPKAHVVKTATILRLAPGKHFTTLEIGEGQSQTSLSARNSSAHAPDFEFEDERRGHLHSPLSSLH